MEVIISKIASACLKRNIVAVDDLEWFRYGLEKRIVSICVGIPFFVVAIFLTGYWSAIAYFFSFYFLRSRANGYHANTPLQCFFSSILLEFILLGLIYPYLCRHGAAALALVSLVLIFIFAPFKHDKMNLSPEEVFACKKSARIRCCILFALEIIFYLVNWTNPMKGLALGSAMAAFLLCYAYILFWRNNNEKDPKNSTENAHQHCRQNGEEGCT